MPEIVGDWRDYLHVSDNGLVISIRNNKNTPWSEAQTWTLSEAEQLVGALRDHVMRARLATPTVKKLAAELRGLHSEPSFEHMALALVDRGWHDRAACPFGGG